MLYIDCKINNVPIQAFIDSGAQSTVMSLRIAQRCNIEWLIDKNCGGFVKGVGGTSWVIGWVHAA